MHLYSTQAYSRRRINVAVFGRAGCFAGRGSDWEAYGHQGAKPSSFLILDISQTCEIPDSAASRTQSPNTVSCMSFHRSAISSILGGAPEVNPRGESYNVDIVRDGRLIGDQVATLDVMVAF